MKLKNIRVKINYFNTKFSFLIYKKSNSKLIKIKIPKIIEDKIYVYSKFIIEVNLDG